MTELNRSSYMELINDDIKELTECHEYGHIGNLSFAHIKSVLEWSVDKIYPPHIWDKKSTREYVEPLDKSDKKRTLTVTDFKEDVDDETITNDDGFGYWVRNGLKSKDDVFSTHQEDATHVVWHNK